MIIRFSHKEQVAKDTYSFYFAPVNKFRYIAGQFIELTIPGAGESPHNKRWFTLSSSPTEELLAVTTRLKPDDVSIFKQALLDLKPGDKVSISEAMGDFILPIDQSLPLTFIAGGIGITPYRSMLQWLYDTKEQRSISLYYGGKHAEHMPFLDAVRDRVSKTYITTGAHLNIEEIADQVAQIGSIVFVSGPEQMVSAISNGLAKRAPRDTQIITDAFLGYS